MSILSPTLKDLCRNFDEEIDQKSNQEFIDGIFYRNNKIEARVSKWKITVDTDVIHSGRVSFDVTRMWARYKRLDDFKFIIYPKSPFYKMMDVITKKKVEFGYPQFEHNFVIKTNNKNKVKNLLGNEKIREIIESQRFLEFEITDDPGRIGDDIAQSISEISFKASSEISDTGRLLKLFELFSEVLKQLCLLKSAY